MEKETLEEVIGSLNKSFKSNVCQSGLDFDEVERIPFSSPRLNYMTYGGIPIGRIIEFAGEEGGGKTTTALDLVAKAQQMFPEKRVLYVDVERTLDARWAKKLGVNTEDLLMMNPNEQTAEEIFEGTKRLIDTGDISLCVLDSLAALVSAQAYSKTIEDSTYGGISKSLTLFSKELIPICARTKCTFIGINQVREDMNSMYGGLTTTGGRAWRHNTSVRMEFRKSDYLNEAGTSIPRNSENPAGHMVKVALVKSKVCSLDRKVGFYILNYLKGIDYYSDIIDLGVKQGIINSSGAWYTVLEENGEVMKKDDVALKFQGKSRLHGYLEENKDVAAQISSRLIL